MKVLIVCSFNSGEISPFIKDQVDNLRIQGLDVDYYLIRGKGIFGYLSNLLSYHKKIFHFKPDVIHAHFGLAGLFASFQFGIPLVITFHGSDINLKNNFILSKIAMLFADKSIFVSKSILTLSKNKNGIVIPCGVDISIFKPIEKLLARKKLNLVATDKLVLFSSSFSNPIKNYPLALDSVNSLQDVKLIELKGYSREMVALLMNACDVCVLTSFTEGSPQFIKEALACNTPVVSVDVGDVSLNYIGISGFFLAKRTIDDISSNLETAFNFNLFNCSFDSRNLIISDFNNATITNKLINLYGCLIL